MKKYAEIHTLGCRLNIADSSLLTARLQSAGYEVVEPSAGVSADLRKSTIGDIIRRETFRCPPEKMYCKRRI